MFETVRLKILVWYNVFSPDGPYLLGNYLVHTYMKLDPGQLNLWPIFGTVGSYKNVFESIVDLYNRINFNRPRFSLSYIHDLVLENKAQVSLYNVCTPTWDIIRLPHRWIRVDIWLEEKHEMIRRMKSIRYICRITCAYLLPHLITYVSELGWDLCI